MEKVSVAMIEVDIFTDAPKECIFSLARAFNVTKEYVLVGGIKLDDLHFMSSGKNYLLYSEVEGDFNVKLDVSLKDLDWTKLNERLLTLSRNGYIFACERYDCEEQAPWDYYIYDRGRRSEIEILDGIELGKGNALFLSIIRH